MSRRTNAAARIASASAAPVRSGKRVRTTLGELVAAAYEAARPFASADDVARLLRYMEVGESARPVVRVD
jgi:hypothetical protein